MIDADALLLFLHFRPGSAPIDARGCPGCGGPLFEAPPWGNVEPSRCEDDRCPEVGSRYVACPVKDCVSPPCCRSSFGPRGWRLVFPHCTDGHGYRWHMPRRWVVYLGPQGQAGILGDRSVAAKDVRTPWEWLRELWLLDLRGS